MEWGLIPAVPVPFRGVTIDEQAQSAYAHWMATQRVAGVAVWAHTGRGPHLTAQQRHVVLDTWRAALPEKVIVAGANSIDMAREAGRGGADALLALPRHDNAVAYHEELGRELPVIAFYLYEAAGGVAYDDDTLHAILALPAVIGIKVATLDSVMTFQRIAAVMCDHPDKLLITGEDRFLGYSLMLGARAALIGMASALTDVHADLIGSYAAGDAHDFMALTARLDRFSRVTFIAPMEGYIRRMLWALAADGVIRGTVEHHPISPPVAQRVRSRRHQQPLRNCASP